MGSYDFDAVIERKGTGSLKYDFGLARAGRTDLLPMWVADMDFRAPREVILAVQQRAEHGIFGYTEPDDGYFEALTGWFEKRYGYRPERSWNTVTPGVVYAISAAVRAFADHGDGVLLQEPVYYPFREMIERNGRICVNNQLVENNGHYEIDFEDFERKIAENGVKLFLLCSPHNPVGRVWNREELTRMAEICRKYQVKIVADEIHCDFIYPGHTFTSFLTLGEEYTASAAVCTSSSKTFNLAGLQTANILIPDRALRRKFRHVNAASGYSQAGTLGLAATEAAYRYGETYLEELLCYLKGNLDFLREYLKENIPEIRLIEPEGTYLVWLDCSGIASSYEELLRLIRDEARLWLDEGAIFGRETELFERINIACPRSVLAEALHQLDGAVKRQEEGRQL